MNNFNNQHELQFYKKNSTSSVIIFILAEKSLKYGFHNSQYNRSLFDFLKISFRTSEAVNTMV